MILLVRITDYSTKQEAHNHRIRRVLTTDKTLSVSDDADEYGAVVAVVAAVVAAVAAAALDVCANDDLRCSMCDAVVVAVAVEVVIIPFRVLFK